VQLFRSKINLDRIFKISIHDRPIRQFLLLYSFYVIFLCKKLVLQFWKYFYFQIIWK